MFSSFKVKHILQTMYYFFSFILVFSNICRQLVTLQALCTVSRVNWLMPGGNKQTCKYYLKDFIEPSMNFPSHQTLKSEMSKDIYPWLFQRRHFEKLSLFFLLCQLNTNLQKSHSNALSQNCQRFNINVTTLRR